MSRGHFKHQALPMTLCLNAGVNEQSFRSRTTPPPCSHSEILSLVDVPTSETPAGRIFALSSLALVFECVT